MNCSAIEERTQARRNSHALHAQKDLWGGAYLIFREIVRFKEWPPVKTCSDTCESPERYEIKRRTSNGSYCCPPSRTKNEYFIVRLIICKSLTLLIFVSSCPVRTPAHWIGQGEHSYFSGAHFGFCLLQLMFSFRGNSWPRPHNVFMHSFHTNAIVCSFRK